jgi:hypothetical protein
MALQPEYIGLFQDGNWYRLDIGTAQRELVRTSTPYAKRLCHPATNNAKGQSPEATTSGSIQVHHGGAPTSLHYRASVARRRD